MNGAIGMDYVDMPLDGAIDMHHNRPYSEFHLKSDLVFDEFPSVDLDSFQETCLKQKLRDVHVFVHFTWQQRVAVNTCVDFFTSNSCVDLSFF